MRNKVNEIIIKVLEEREIEFQGDTITEETKLREDLGFDSLGLALLTVHIEEEFNVDIFEDDIVSKVGQIYKKLNI